NMGVSVSDTKAEISTADPITTPNSRKRRPTNPSKNITGRKTAASVTEIEITAKKISFDPLIAAEIGDIPSSTFLNIFSVTTIPSSTTKPVAKTMANSVNTVIEKPQRYMIKNVAISDTGISTSGRKAMDQLRKNMYIINTTNIMAMISVSTTSRTDFFIKRVLSMAIFNSKPSGKSFNNRSYSS